MGAGGFPQCRRIVPANGAVEAEGDSGCIEERKHAHCELLRNPIHQPGVEEDPAGA